MIRNLLPLKVKSKVVDLLSLNAMNIAKIDQVRSSTVLGIKTISLGGERKNYGR